MQGLLAATPCGAAGLGRATEEKGATRGLAGRKRIARLGDREYCSPGKENGTTRGCRESPSRAREDGEGERTHLEPPDSWRRQALAAATVMARCSAWLSMHRGKRRVGTGRIWEWVVFLLASWACCVRGRLGRRIGRLWRAGLTSTVSHKAANGRGERLCDTKSVISSCLFIYCYFSFLFIRITVNE